MSEITLTGGTLVPSSSDHNHAHKAGNGGACCDHHHNKNGIEMTETSSRSPQQQLDLATATDPEIARIFFTLMRFGRFEAFPKLLQELKEKDRSITQILQSFDEGGHTLLHWASKRVDDVRFLQKLIDLAKDHSLAPSLLNLASKDNVGMGPIHWACTEGSIPHTALLLQHGANMEARDNSGCTPLLIAAQYGRVNVVAYLLKKGANLKAVDSSLDTAMHWAAYKGSNEVCGLLAYYETMSFATQDAYGQSPLHLASLRGNTSVVRYILQQLQKAPKSERDVLFVKDKNERTPLDLAIHKKRGNVEIVLREAMSAARDPKGHFFRSTLGQVCSLRNWKFWCGMVPMLDEMDTPSRLPFYIVLVNLVLHFCLMISVMAPFASAGSGLLWDKSGLLLVDFVSMFCVWYFYTKTVKTSPGFLDDSHPDIGKWRRLYEETLESLVDEGNASADHDAPKPRFELCHTCHVARPYRSKYCRVTRKCVLLFDHFCPFVDNTVGLNNYSYFFLFLLSIVTAILSYSVTWIMYASRYTAEHGSYPWLVMLLSAEISFILVPVFGLFVYHLQLTLTNLTTNEHMNMRKYRYLFPVIGGQRVFKNPWDKGYFGNFMDRMSPSRDCYEIPADFESLIHNDAPMPASSCCRHGKCESA